MLMRNCNISPNTALIVLGEYRVLYLYGCRKVILLRWTSRGVLRQPYAVVIASSYGFQRRLCAGKVVNCDELYLLKIK